MIEGCGTSRCWQAESRLMNYSAANMCSIQKERWFWLKNIEGRALEPGEVMGSEGRASPHQWLFSGLEAMEVCMLGYWNCLGQRLLSSFYILSFGIDIFITVISYKWTKNKADTILVERKMKMIKNKNKPLLVLWLHLGQPRKSTSGLKMILKNQAQQRLPDSDRWIYWASHCDFQND